MLPLLPPGEEVLVNPDAYRDRLPQAGEIVVVRHPYNPNLRLIKWVVSGGSDQGCFVQGLNLAESTDSRHFGLVPQTCLLGQVVCRFP